MKLCALLRSININIDGPAAPLYLLVARLLERSISLMAEFDRDNLFEMWCVSKVLKMDILPEPDRLIRLAEVCRLTSLSRTTIWRLRRKGEFPRPVRLSPGIIVDRRGRRTPLAG